MGTPFINSHLASCNTGFTSDSEWKQITATFNTKYHLGPTPLEQIPIQINILHAADIFSMTVRSDALNKSQGANRLGSRFSLVMLFIIVTGYGRIKVRARRCNHTYFSKVMHHLLDALLVSKWCTTYTQHCCHTCANYYSRCCITFVDSYSECCIIMAYMPTNGGGRGSRRGRWILRARKAMLVTYFKLFPLFWPFPGLIYQNLGSSSPK